MLTVMKIFINISTYHEITKVSKIDRFFQLLHIFSVYSCEIQVVPNEIIFVEEKADYPWTQMLRWAIKISVISPGLLIAIITMNFQ